MITVLRNAALHAMSYRKELTKLQRQQADISQLETQVHEFQNSFHKSHDLAKRQFTSAIDEIDKTISHLEKVKQGLLSASRNLQQAQLKADNLTVYSSD